MQLNLPSTQFSMKRLVRHKITRAYLSPTREWTENPRSAEHFPDLQTILRVQRRFNLTDIEVVLQMGEEPSGEYDVALSLENP